MSNCPPSWLRSQNRLFGIASGMLTPRPVLFDRQRLRMSITVDNTANPYRFR
jgi:hypothetical protein